MRTYVSRMLKVVGLLHSLCSVSYIGAFWGKTELDLNGISVIKEAAEILSRSIDTFPSRSTAIAFIGLIFLSQGIYLFGKGFVNLLSSSGGEPDRTRGKAQFMLGTLLTVCGTIATIFSANIALLCFG